MPPSRKRVLLGLGLAGAASALLLACTPWSIGVPGTDAFVSRGLAGAYGLSLTARGRTEVAFLPMPRLRFHDVRVSAGSPEGPTLAEGGTLSIQLNLLPLLSGRAEAAALALDGATLFLPAGPEDDRWAGPLRRLIEGLSQEDGPHPRRITLNQATVIARDPRGAARQTVPGVDLHLSWPLWSEAVDAAGGFTWQGVPVRFAATGLRPRDLADGRASPFAATASWAGGTLHAEAEAAGGGVSGRGRLRLDSLPDTLAWIGADLALAPAVGDLALEGRFEASAEGLRLPELRVSTGGNLLEGAGSARFGPGRTGMQATLAADTLDLSPLAAALRRLAAPQEAAGQGRAPTWGAAWGGTWGGTWGEAPLPVATLTGGDLDLRLSAARAHLGGVTAEDVAASVLVRDGGIEASLSRARVQGGMVKGRIALSQPRGAASPPAQVKAHGAFDGVDLGALLIDLGQPRFVLGPAQGSFALEAGGRDVQGLARSLQGRALLSIQDGTIAGLDLAEAVQRPGGVAARSNARTPFERAHLALQFRDGLGTVTDGGLRARGLTATLRGRVSLPERHVLARADLAPPAAATDAAAPTALFEIAGPWENVTWRAGPLRDGPGEAGGAAFGDPLGLLGAVGVPASSLPNLPAPIRAYAP